MAAPRFEREGLPPPGNFEAAAANAARVTSSDALCAGARSQAGYVHHLFTTHHHVRKCDEAVTMIWRVFYRLGVRGSTQKHATLFEGS
jgi:hypothetical protein